MSESTSQLGFSLGNTEEMTVAAEHIVKSKLYADLKTVSEVMVMFMLCKSENIPYITALKRYHIIEGKPSMRADAMQGDFLAHGGEIVWHVRSDEMVCATIFRSSHIVTDEAIARGAARFELLWTLEIEQDPAKKAKSYIELSKLSRSGEETVLRTFADAVNKGLAVGKGDVIKTNWAKSPRQMLTARVITEGVRLMAPGLIAGIYTPEEIEDFTPRAEKEERRQLNEKESMQAILNQHLEDAELATMPAERQRLLGLAAEMRCKIAEMDVPIKPSSLSQQPDYTEQHEGSETKVVDANLVVMPPEEQKPAWMSYKLKRTKLSAEALAKTLSEFNEEELAFLYKARSVKFLESKDPELKLEAEMIRDAVNSRSSQ